MFFDPLLFKEGDQLAGLELKISVGDLFVLIDLVESDPLAVAAQGLEEADLHFSPRCN